MRPVDLLAGDDQRRHQADRVVVDSVDDKSSLQASQLKLFGFRRLELEGLHEAETAQILRPEVLDCVAQNLTHLRGVANETVALDHVQHGQCRGAGQRVAAERRPMVARFEDSIAAGSLKATWTNPSGSGWNGSEYLGWPPAVMVASVRPWKEPVVVMISNAPSRLRAPHFRASLMAASFASAPELQKKTREGNESSTRRRARSICGCVK